MKILYIDDNQTDIFIVKENLAQDGCEVDSADNIAEGLRLALTGSYDVVICDVLLANNEDGLYFVKTFTEADSTTPVLLTSAAFEMRRIEKPEDFINYRGFILKPITFEEITKHLEVA